MVNRISKINVKAKNILSDELIDIFDFEPKKWINIFYCPNWFWKSTLFKVIKEILSFDSSNELNIPTINIDWYHIYSILVELNIWSEKFPLKYVYKESKQQLERKFEIEDLIKKIYNQTKRTIKEEKSFMDSRTSPASLNRYSFINSDRILSSDWNRSSIIDSHRDWKIKWVLFDYILWMKFENSEEENLKNLNASYYFCKNEHNIKKYKNELTKMWKDKKDFWLFSVEQEEKMKELWDYQNDFQELNISIVDLNYAINKLNNILEEIEWKEAFNDLEKVVVEELNNLNQIKDFCEENLRNNKIDLDIKLEEYKDWVQNDQIQYIKLKKDIEDLEEKNKSLKMIYKKYSDKKEKNRKDFESTYKSFLKELDLENCEFDIDELKLDINNIENASEATLKICRILFFLSLQKLKSDDDKIKNLWIWFYDWVLDWVWYDKIINLLQITKWITMQTFYFVPKLVDSKDTDPFENKLIDLEKKWEIKLYKKWDNEKIFSK